MAQQKLEDPATYPATLPAFSALRVDRAGRLWVQRYPRPLKTTQEWWAFSADAHYLGRVEMPAAFIVDEIGEDYVAGSYLRRRAVRPENDVIHAKNAPEYEIRVYRLARVER